MLIIGISDKDLTKMLIGKQLDQLPASLFINFIKYIIN